MFDQMVVIIVGFFTVIALFRGFIRELLGMIGLSSSIIGTFYLTPYATGLLVHQVSSIIVAQILGCLISFLCLLIITGIVNNMISGALTSIRHGVFDTVLGGLVGFVKGYVICVIIYLFSIIAMPVLHPGTEVGDDEIVPEWISKSRTYPLFLITRQYIDNYMKVEYESGKLHFGRVTKPDVASQE